MDESNLHEHQITVSEYESRTVVTDLFDQLDAVLVSMPNVEENPRDNAASARKGDKGGCSIS
jgi:hypothetical protein